MVGEKLDQETLENIAGDIAALLCGRLPDSSTEINLHTECVTLKSRTVVQVFASRHGAGGLFTVNLEMKNF